MKRTLSILLSLIMALAILTPAFSVFAEDQPVLARDGATDYVIVVGRNASPTERTAADTLADYLKRITGAEFPIVTDETESASHEIVVGVTGRDAEIGIDRTGFDEDTILLKTAGEKLFLTGGEKRGALYAVYTFLEDHLGCRWFTHDLTVVSSDPAPVLAPIDRVYTPPIKLRQTYWTFSTVYPDYCAAHKLHGLMAYLPDEMGGGRWDMVVNSVHTMNQIVPRELFDTHPEYFGMDDKGNRSSGRQPCFSNPDVLQLAIDYAKRFFASYDTILSVSQNDGMEFCQCPDCKAFNKAHGGADSASLLRFVNEVAKEAAAFKPGAKVETLAYQSSQKPPVGIRPEKNVVIRLCAIATCVLHDLDDPKCPKNKTFADDITAWQSLTDNLYIWEYSTNFQYYYVPYPNLTTMQNRYRFFADHGVKAVFDNGCYESIVPAEFHELRTYLVCKLLWDPDTDYERDMAEFCEAYYGEAGKDVIEFIHTFEDSIKGYNALAAKVCHFSCSDGGENIEANTSFTRSDVRKLDAILDKAAEREVNAQQTLNLERLTLSWRLFKNATFSGEFNWFSAKNDPEKEAIKLYHDLRDHDMICMTEAWGLYLTDEEPNGKVRPTFWYTPEADLPASVRFQAKLLPFFNSVLRTLFGVFYRDR